MSGDITINCARCGAGICLTRAHHERLVRTGETFYCPNGHGNAYNKGKSEADRLREELERCRKERDRAWTQGILDRKRISELQKQVHGYKGALAAMRNRLHRAKAWKGF